MHKIQRALISVSDKSGVVDLAHALVAAEVEILSTGGTAKLLAEHGIAVTEVAERTGFPEILDGRVKTLHPAIHAALLARRDRPDHMATLAEHGITPIDLLIVNLYPFARTVAQPGCGLEEAIENIDIGGPAMLRAAAKNCDGVVTVVDPADYAEVIAALGASDGIPAGRRLALARKVFAHTAAYDGTIASWLSARQDDGSMHALPGIWNAQWHKVQDMRYGENPHQAAAFYRDTEPAAGTVAQYRQLQGKELSYNNIADADAAWECVKSFDTPACVIVKHANPCGVAVGADCAEAYARAFATDPTSAFGGIIAFNRPLDAAGATAVARQFVEVLMAPGFDAEARRILAAKQNVRVLEVPLAPGGNAFELKRVGGGLLVQTRDDHELAPGELKIVTKRAPTQAQLADLLFAWRVAKFVKSNAIVFCGEGRTLGVGAGQMSRVDSARIAAIKAENAGLSLAGSVVASDAFFPFRDGLDVVVDAGASCVIQPGGSVRDAEVIAAADERGVIMAFTGIRHFRH